MRRRSAITAALTVLVIAGAVYYFYGYRNRDISSDFNAAREYTEDAGTTAAVKSALALNKQVASFDIHVDSANNADTKGNNVTLTGHVPTEEDKRVAEVVCAQHKGVAMCENTRSIRRLKRPCRRRKTPDLKPKKAWRPPG